MSQAAAPGIRRLAKGTAVYAGADLLAKGGAYALIPILTRALGSSEYGIYALVASIVPLITLVSSLGLGGAVTRMWFDLTPEKRKSFNAAAFLSVQAVALGLSVALTLAAGPVFGGIFKETGSSYFVFGVWVAFFLASSTVPLAVLRAEEKPKQFAVLSASQFVGPSVGVLIALGAGAGVRGALWGQVLGSAAVMLISAGTMTRIGSLPASWPMLRPALALGAPIVPHLVAHWALNVADRPAIERTLGVAAVGLYAVGYQIAQGVSLIATAINNATVPSFYRAAQNDRRETLGRAWAPMLLAIGFFALGASMFGEELVAVLAAPRYKEAYKLIPWVALGYWFLAAYYFPVNALFYAKRVAVIPIATAVAAVVNYVLNINLLPDRGLIAAAQNTAVAYAILFAIVMLAAQRIFPLPYRYWKAGLVAATGAGVYAVSTLLPHNIAGTFAKLGLLAVYCTAGFAIVKDDIGYLRSGGAARGSNRGSNPDRRVVVLTAATATQARTMVACAAALVDAGLKPRFVSLDPILGKSASAGFRQAGVSFDEPPALGSTLWMILRGRASAAAIVEGAGAVVIGNDFTPFERLLIEQSRASGAATALVQDGVISAGGEQAGKQAGGGARSGSAMVRIAKKALSAAGFPFQARPYGMGGCDVVCVYGPSTKAALEARGAEPGRVVVTGQPRYDTAVAPAVARHAKRDALLVATQPFSRYGLATLGHETATFAAMIQAAIDGAGGREVVVKLHPDTGAESESQLRRRFDGKVTFEQAAPIEELYPRALVVIALSSTTALEGLIHRIPVVVVDVPGFPSTLPYTGSGAVAPVRNLEELPSAVAEAIASPTARDAARDEFLKQHLAPLDGGAAKRVCDAVVAIVLRPDA